MSTQTSERSPKFFVLRFHLSYPRGEILCLAPHQLQLYFDLSGFPGDSPYYDKSNKVLGKFKDECDGKAPSEFMGSFVY